MKLITRSVFLILVLALLMPASVVYAQGPPAGQTFWGSATLDSAPANGESVTARMNDRQVGSDIVSGGTYDLIIQTIEADNGGDTITFFIAGYDAGSTSFTPGDITERNLSATSPTPQYTLTINTDGNGNPSGDGTYDEDTVVNINANPDNGWGFVNWTGDTGTIPDANDPTTTITMDSAKTITANYSLLPTYDLTINENGNGSTSGDGTYYEGEDADITATPDIGSQFDEWTGDIDTIANVNGPTTSITMNGNYDIFANFSEASDVTLTMAVTGSGSTSPAVGGHTYPANTVVNITATPDSGWLFINWTGGVANSNLATTTILMDSNKTVTANFSPAAPVTLTMAINGNGSTNPPVGENEFSEGQVVTITAVASSGWQFDNWTGAVANSNSATTTVTMDTDKTVTANFSPAPNVTLTMAASGSGSTSPSVGAHTYPIGTVVNIAAIAAGGWEFDGWTGAVANPNSAITTVTMDTDKTVTANFSQIPTYTLTMAVTGNGSTSPAIGSYSYSAGSVVNIAAIAASGWEFDSWTGAVTNTGSVATTVIMTSNKTVTASFSRVQTYTLTMAASGNGSTSPGVGTYTYPAGTVVNIAAIADSGWGFNNWTGAVANVNSAITTVTMSSSKTITANFSRVPTYTLTMAASGNGSTSPGVGTYTYPIGTVVNIAAIADSGWGFNSWTGAVASLNSAATTVTMTSNKTVTANFSQIPVTYYTLTMAVSGNGSTSPTVGNYSYSAGTVVPIAAMAASGWGFDNWTGAVANISSAVTTVIMNADKTVTANFSFIEDITPPVILAISAPNISKTSADISWATNEPADSQVDYWASPGVLTPLDETLVTSHLVHLADLAPATTYYYKVMSRDAAGNLAVSDEYTFTTAGLPATFTTGDWDISLSEVDTGTEATISFWVTNTGDLAGSHQVAIAVDGTVEMTREVILDAGASEEITFTTIKDVAGTYLMTAVGLSVSFTIAEAAPPPATDINWWLIIGIAIGLILLLILIIILTRRDAEKARKWPEQTTVARTTGKTKALLGGAVSWISSHQPFKAREPKEMAGGEVDQAAEAKERARREAEEAKNAIDAERRARQEVEREAEAKAEKEALENIKALPQQPGNGLYVKIKDGGDALTVTALAVENLKEAIRTQTTDPEVGIRIMPSPANPSQFEMALDKKKEGDQVVESEGLKILLFRPELTSSLEGMVIDCQKTPQGVRFTMSKLPPST